MGRGAKIPGRLALVLLSLGLGLLSAEAFLRAKATPGALASVQLDGEQRGPARFTIDPEAGFTPILGGPDYGPEGARWNDYPAEKQAGVERILFLGDSVVARGQLTEALKRRLERPSREWWNAGVESFDLLQTVAYFRRHGVRLDPDRVVLVFHVNDYQTTPVEFTDQRGERVRYAPRPPRANRWAYGYEHIRLWRAVADALWSKADERDRERANRAALAELSELCAARGIQLSVVLFPALLPEGAWPPELLRWHRAALDACKEAGVSHVDLWPAVRSGFETGLELQWEAGDWAHPSEAGANHLAEYLLGWGLLADG